MTDLEAIEARHSVRKYVDKKIEQNKLDILLAEVDKINEESGLKIKLFHDEPNAFKGIMPHYGRFTNVSNYFAMVGKNTKELHEKIGYFGERLVLLAQKLGLNTCWVAMKLYFKNKSVKPFINKDEKLVCMITLGYGENQGISHKSKAYDDVATPNNAPEWFKEGVKAALLAPTAMNQQKFRFELKHENSVKATTQKGFYSKIDLGIAKFHFEIGAGKQNFTWSN